MALGAERRQFGRRQTYLHGWISVPGRPKLSCIVRDISVAGAKLELQAPSWLPFTFQLTIDASRFATMCEIRHQGPASIGVRFIEAVAQSDADNYRTSDKRSLDDKQSWMGD